MWDDYKIFRVRGLLAFLKGTEDNHTVVKIAKTLNVPPRLSGGSCTYTVDITLSGAMSHSKTQTDTGSDSVDGMDLSMTGVRKSAAARENGSLRVTGKLQRYGHALPLTS